MGLGTFKTGQVSTAAEHARYTEPPPKPRRKLHGYYGAPATAASLARDRAKQGERDDGQPNLPPATAEQAREARFDDAERRPSHLLKQRGLPIWPQAAE